MHCPPRTVATRLGAADSPMRPAMNSGALARIPLGEHRLVVRVEVCPQVGYGESTRSSSESTIC
jgi:hypothetical protein